MELAAELQSLMDDDDNHETQPSVHHRTVDEILLLYDSSSSSAGSPSPPASPSHSSSPASSSYNGNGIIRSHNGSPKFSTTHSSQLGLVDDNGNTNSCNAIHNNISSHSVSLSSRNSSDSLASPTPKLLSNSHSLDSAFLQSSMRLSSSNLSSQRILQTPTSSLPPLFTATKSNAKPGAALAAAAAASRSVPTRHAAAIKSSRFTTSSVASASPSSSPSASSLDVATEVNDDSPNNFQSTLRRKLNQETGVVEEADSERQFSEPRHLDNLFMEQNLRNLAAENLSSGHSFVEVDDNGSATGVAFPVAVAPLHSDLSAEHLDFDESATAASLVLDDGQAKQSQSPFPSESHDGEDDVDENPSFNTANMVVQEVLDAENEKSVLIDEVHGQEKHGTFHEPKGDAFEGAEDDNADIAQGAHEQQNNHEDTKSTDKKSNQIILSPLEEAEELEKKQAFAGLHLEEGAAAQPMRLEGVRRVSTMLGYFDIDSRNTITRTISKPDFTREHGYPVVLAVHVLYIAIGMSKGIILVLPSKYSPHNSDNMDAKMSKHLQGDRPYGPVTSLCFSQQGDFLFSGYGNGHIAVWDVQKASAVKVITEHKAPVVHMLYLGQDSQVSKQFNVVSGDSKGVVKLIRFSFFSLVKTYKATVLCDEKMGVVICASSLLSSEGIGELMASQVSNPGTSSNWSMIGGAIGVDTGSRHSPAPEDGVFIFVFHQYALVAKYVPSADNVVKYAHFPKPDGVGEGSMPYASWRSVFDSNDSSTEKAAYLAIAWDRTVQVSKLVKSELNVYAKWTVDCSAVGLAWLDDQVLVILTSAGQLEMFTKDGTIIHETSFSVDVSRGDDLITCHTFFNNSYGNPEKAYHNCVAARGASIYVLGPSYLVICRLLPWKERVEDLRRGGDWIGALNMAMVLYDGQAHGAIDLPRTLEEIRMAIMPDLVKLVLSYVDEVFSYIKIASGNQVGNADQLNKSFNSSSGHPEVKEQYIRVGGVAVEFCVHIKRTDILFDEIYAKFDAARHKETFLELLEPYILKDMLGSLPPEIMQALVEHYSMKGWLQRVEQCVLHMDISSLDFNQVVRLCREHGLHGALIYLFNKGLEDFRTPLEELFVVLHNCESGSASALGYRILVYLKYCFQGLAFPPGHGTLPAARLFSIKDQILQFLLDVSTNPKSHTDTNLPSSSQLPNLCHLLQLDTLATLNVLRSAFEDGSINSTEVKVLGSESQHLVQKLVDSLCTILEGSYFKRDYSSDSHSSSSNQTWPSKEDDGYMFEFIAYYVAYEGATVSRNTLSQVLEYLTSVRSPTPGDLENNFRTMKTREKQLLALLDVVPDTDWDAPHLLFLCERCQFHQVCAFIHSRQHQYVAALDSYLKAADEPIHAFSFIHDMLQLLSKNEFDSFQAAVISRLVDLIKLDREGTFFVVIHHFYGQSQNLFSVLQSHPESLFLYLKTLIEVHTTGNVKFSCLKNDGSLYYPRGTIAKHQSDRVKIFLKALSEFPKLLRSNPIQLTDEMTELYFELLCRYERESVLKFLETFESYRVESCLRLCQDYDIVDAAAFLLERVGDVGNALSLMLSSLSEKFIILESSMGSTQSDSVSPNLGTVLKEKEVRVILDIVHSCIGLCQRNSPRLGSHESESLWFQLLDSFCLPLTNSWEPRPQVPDKSLATQEDEKTCKIKQKKLMSHKSSHILRKLRSLFIREIVEAMIGHVDISTIMLKLLSDNRIQEFGDIKPTILGMLGTYDFERRILDTAKSLIEDDTYYTMNLLKKEASHGYAPQDLACCICNCPLAKNSSIQVFSCSHALHVNCAGAVTSGCPICVAARSTRRSSKAVVVDNGLVSKASSTHQKAPGTSSLHSTLDSDIFENSYSHHPVSRFELLNSLHKNERSVQIDNMPSLRLAPPAVYHEKVKKGVDLMAAGTINSTSKAEKSSRQSGDATNGSSSRFKLRSTIFGKERSSKRLQ